MGPGPIILPSGGHLGHPNKNAMFAVPSRDEPSSAAPPSWDPSWRWETPP